MSKKSNHIHIEVELDENSVPEQIHWKADDSFTQGEMSTKAISLSFWDPKDSNTLRLDLWTKDMPVEDMKKFYIEILGGMSQSLLNATSDEYMAEELQMLSDNLVDYLKEQLKP